MADLVFLRDLVVILAVAVFVVTFLHRLKIPSIAAFIFAGMLVGPQGLALINDIHQVEIIAEIGIALLLFGIGLELSLERLKRLWKPIIIGGFLQVGLSILAAYTIARLAGLAWQSSLFIGFIISVSSTAIVLKGLETRGETDAPHGRIKIGILVFQDLCVVPMMLAIPLLSGSDTSSMEILMTLGRAVLIVIGVVLASRLIIPRFLNIIAATRQRHLFVMAVLLICIGTAWITSAAGVSLALGAFLAGLVVAGSEYRSQALSDVISFKDVFTSVFFVSVGMLLSAVNIIHNIFPVLIILVAVLFGKLVVVLIACFIMRLPLRVSILAAVGLAQIGEFSFLLIRTSQGTNLISDPLSADLIAVAIISMFLTPFALSLAPKMAAGVGKMRALNKLLKVSTAEEAELDAPLKNHIIIGGYGFAGQELAMALKKCGMTYVIVDLNSENIHRALARGEPAYYGDITSGEVLERLGLTHALSFVIVINDPSAVEQAIRAARMAAPKIHIIARTRYLLDIEPLKRAGADEIIAAEQEAAIEIVSHILRKCRVEQSSINHEADRIRTDIGENPSHS
ncbi:MAG: hypothetical protein CVT49_15985 [candidate division Zixibacteria bacterium HGW-Zixibacteria-1]|nr:MAG: hypothetical protein CVT49_15985 [candidate division Zixibacteria bacterium HGW-Zixibacteria-1]